MKDYLGKFMKQRNYFQIRSHHKKLWIEREKNISCLVVSNGLIYSVLGIRPSRFGGYTNWCVWSQLRPMIMLLTGWLWVIT